MNKNNESKIRIAFLGPAPPYRGGISQFAFMLAREFGKEGYQVKMISFLKQYPALIFPGGEQKTNTSAANDLETAEVFTPYLPWTWNKAV
ncbi:MAG TPA: glycosyl transferase family 1, partial [Candidatus Cloacimonadota bacterium]|nr:glycosyl transferase family 1 [Candidatus Cloacimonadota bacterium]